MARETTNKVPAGRKTASGTQWELTDRPGFKLVGYFASERAARRRAAALGLAREYTDYVVREVLA